MSTTIASYTLGGPQVAGPLAVYPVFGPPPVLPYHGLSAAIALGAYVKELDQGASVREVTLENPTYLPILLYEGEQISGAQQNRSIDTSILVPARSGIPIPVSCIEHGRWDGGRHSEPFRVSPHTSDPALRGVKREHSNRPEGDGRPDQGRVWAEVESRLEIAGVSSSTDSLEDLFAMRSHRIEELREPLELERDQIGAVVEVSGLPVALDLVSRSEVFEALFPALSSGYALQAADAEPAAPDDERAERFLAKAVQGRRRLGGCYGLGRTFTVSRKHSVGAGIVRDGELIALSAFPRQSPIT
jgi:hypothetical protein